MTLWGLSGTFFAVIFGAYLMYRAPPLEKLAAGTILFGWFATPFLQMGYDLGLQGKLLDVFVLAVLLGISIRFRRIWILMTCSLQFATTMSHLVVVLANWKDPDAIGYWTYFTTMGLVGGKGIALAMGIGVWETIFWQRYQSTHAL